MKKMNPVFRCGVFVLLGTSIALNVNAGHKAAAQSVVPESWYLMPEDAPQGSPLARAVEAEEGDENVAEAIDRIYDVNAAALDGLKTDDFISPLARTDKPKDWTPWHLEMFTTDLSVSAQGVLGALVMKGTPSVSTYWRRQNVANPSPATELAEAEATLVSDDMPKAELAGQVEPVIRAALATGVTKDETALRASVLNAAMEFQGLARTLAATPTSSQWWVSQLRIDFSIDASGKVHPVVTVGGDVKFRFHWVRMMRATPASPAVAKAASPGEIKANESLLALVMALQADLEELSSSALEHCGFKAHGFRVGIGMSAKGAFGIVKGGATVIGQLHFARSVKKPVVNPVPPTEPSGTIALIEDKPVASHLAFAGETGTAVETLGRTSFGGVEQAVYQVDRAKFRKGLRKAMKLGEFFAKRAARTHSRVWRPFELKIGYDMSVGGTVGVATLNGLAVAEIAFYNLKF